MSLFQGKLESHSGVYKGGSFKFDDSFSGDWKLPGVFRYRDFHTVVEGISKSLNAQIRSQSMDNANATYLDGEVIIRAAYGIQVQDRDDPYIAAAERGLWIANECMAPGRWLVDIIPICE